MSVIFRSFTRLTRTRVIQRNFSFSPGSYTLFRSPYPDLDIKQQPLSEYLFQKLDLYPNNTALVDIESGETYTCSQTKTYAVKIASAIRKLGYKKGDVIAIHAANSAKYAILLLALPAAGVTMTTSNFASTPDELARNLELTRASGIFTSSSLLPTVKNALNSNKNVNENIKEIVTIDETADYRSLKTLMEDDGTAFPENLDVDLDNDLVALPFSSGTTGLPKAVMLNNRSIVTNLQQMSYPLRTTPDDSFIGVLPFFHAYGMIIVTYYALQGGNKSVIMPRFDPQLYLQAIQEHKISFLHLVPPIALFLAKHPGFGMTEIGPCDTIDADSVTTGTVGHLVPNTKCKIIIPETGKIVPNVGDSGELCLKGPQMMKGYLNNPEATNDLMRDGWIHTGDIAYVREDGKIVITDRSKDLIKYKAYQIAPAELENLLLTHPSVQDAAVIGIPDDKTGEIPRAYIVRKPKYQTSDEDIFDFIKEKVSGYKLLRGGIEFIDEIPKSPSGKILRRILKEKFLKT